MPTNQRFHLIDGTFSPEDAKKILLDLIRSKMDFHSLQLVSNRERFGQDLLDSERRLGELKTMESSLKAVIDSTAGIHRKMRVDGWIEISFCGEDP